MVGEVARSSAYRLIKNDDDSIEIKPPQIKGLVLSGGGARGIAYAAMIRVMTENDQLESITHVSGASAGAMTASFIALGISPENIKNICTKVSLFNLLDSSGYLRFRAKGERFRNFFEVIYFIQIKQYLLEVKSDLHAMSISQVKDYAYLNAKKNNYSFCLKDMRFDFDSFGDLYDLCNSTVDLEKLDACFKKLSKKIKGPEGNILENPRFNFNDFERVRNILPDCKKHKIKHLSVVVTNTSAAKLEFHDCKQSGNKSVADKCQLSGAHPFLFSPSKNSLGEYRADGAIINSMPAEALIQNGLTPHEILCVALSSNKSVSNRIYKAKKTSLDSISDSERYIDKVTTFLFGNGINQYFADEYNREKLFYHMGTMLFLNAGNISVTDRTNTDKQKENALALGAQSTIEYFKNRTKKFDNYLLAMMYLGKDALENILRSTNDQTKQEVFALQAKHIGDLQSNIVLGLSNNSLDDFNLWVDDMKSTLANKDLCLSHLQQKKILCLCIKQINYLSKGLLEKYCAQQVNNNSLPKEKHWFLALLTLLKESLEWIFCSTPKTLTPREIEQNKIATDLRQTRYDFFQEIHLQIINELDELEEPAFEPTVI